MELWQQRWDDDIRGRWTAKLIRNLGTWIQRNGGKRTFVLTQFLIGNGYFHVHVQWIGSGSITSVQILQMFRKISILNQIRDSYYLILCECERERLCVCVCVCVCVIHTFLSAYILRITVSISFRLVTNK